MPIYEYQCQDCGHVFDALQKMSDDPLTECPDCGQHSLRKLVSAPNFKLKGGVLRGEEEIELNVQLGDAATRIAANEDEQKLKDLGMTLAPLTDEIRQSLGVDEDVSGAVVVRVDPNGTAASQGFRRGDIVIQADRQEIESPADLRKAMAGAEKKGKASVPVLVKRGDVQRFASLPVG